MLAWSIIAVIAAGVLAFLFRNKISKLVNGN